MSLKYASYAAAVIGLLISLPILHALLVFGMTSIATVHPSGREIFSLFTTPAWIASVIIFSLELSRTQLLYSHVRYRHALLLGVISMITTTIALIISPIGGNIAMMDYVVTGLGSFVLGTLGGVIYKRIIY